MSRHLHNIKNSAFLRFWYCFKGLNTQIDFYDICTKQWKLVFSMIQRFPSFLLWRMLSKQNGKCLLYMWSTGNIQRTELVLADSGLALSTRPHGFTPEPFVLWTWRLRLCDKILQNISYLLLLKSLLNLGFFFKVDN